MLFRSLSGYTKFDEVPYDFIRKRLSVVVAHGRNQHLMITKGAFANVLAVCTKAALPQGDVPVENVRYPVPREWETTFPNFRYVPVLSEPAAIDQWAGRTGLVHQAVLEDFADLSNHEVYACGAPIVVDSARRDYLANGLAEDDFFADSFTSEADKAPA